MIRAKKLMVIYDPQDIKDLVLYLATHPEPIDVLALDAEVEYRLEEKGIRYLSGRMFRDSEPVERIVFADEYAQQLKSSAWDFLAYRGVSLGALFAFPLQDYFNRVLYYTELFKRVADTSGYAEWIVYEPIGGPPFAGGPLSVLMYRVVLRSASYIAELRGITLHTTASRREITDVRAHRSYFLLTRSLFSIIVAVLNTIISVLRRPRKVRLLVSDYWRNTSAWVTALPESEILLFDRSEIVRIPFRTIWKHRMRFIHLDQFLSRADKHRAVSHRLLCEKKWQTLRAQVEPVSFRGVDLRPLLLEVFDILIVFAVAPVCSQIDGAYALIGKTRPTAVVVRTSVSGQTHFSVLALVSQKLDVPSIEQQHGLEYFGAGSMSRDHVAQYLALYGPKIRAELEHVGYEPRRLLNIGSPRFDVYHSLATENKNAVLCIGPDLYLGSGFDSYDCVDYFAAFFTALPKGMRVIVKLRGRQRESFFISTIERLQGAHECGIEKEQPLSTVLTEARLVVSCYSTAVLETMKSGVPVIIVPTSPMDTVITHFHFDDYVPSGAVRIADSTEELASALEALKDRGTYQVQREAALNFLSKNFLFDDQASERFAELVRSLAKR